MWSGMIKKEACLSSTASVTTPNHGEMPQWHVTSTPKTRMPQPHCQKLLWYRQQEGKSRETTQDFSSQSLSLDVTHTNTHFQEIPNSRVIDGRYLSWKMAAMWNKHTSLSMARFEPLWRDFTSRASERNFIEVHKGALLGSFPRGGEGSNRAAQNAGRKVQNRKRGGWWQVE